MAHELERVVPTKFGRRTNASAVAGEGTLIQKKTGQVDTEEDQCNPAAETLTGTVVRVAEDQMSTVRNSPMETLVRKCGH